MSSVESLNPMDLQLEVDVIGAQKGDHEAFGRLVDRCSNTVSSIILAVVRDYQAVEDIAQDVFLSAWANIKKLRNPASFLPWIRQTARNRANTWLRQHLDDRHRHLGDESLLAAVVDPKASPTLKLLRREEQKMLHDFIEQLPEEAREVVTLYYREGRSTRQVALLLELREETVRQRLSRARVKLRESMMERFGSLAARTATGAAFTSAVLTAMTVTAPVASAGTAGSAAAKAVSAGLFGKFGAALMSALPGAFAGLLGIYIGFRKEWRRERNPKARAKLLRLAVYAGVATVGTSLALAVSGVTNDMTPGFVAYTGFSVVLLLVCGVELPKVIAPSQAKALAANPELAGAQARERRFKRMTMVGGFLLGWGTMAVVYYLKTRG